MKKYRLLINGRNFSIRVDGKIKKHGFFQHIFVEAENSQQAKLLAVAKLRHDNELNRVALNPERDPPKIEVDTFWEIDVLDDERQIETGRTFYLEKKWWQFWK